MSRDKLTLRIFGRVQGVWFRDFAYKHAKRLGIAGFVRNENDGSLTIKAEGKKEDLVEFIKRCRRGPVASAVAKIDEIWEDATGQFWDFRIL